MRSVTLFLAAASALAAGSLTAAAIGATPAPSHRVTFTLPDETIPAELADEAGEPVVAHCTACHSLEYIVTQPRGKGPQFWKDEVAKMVNVYKAPVEPTDAEAVSAVLERKFG